MSEEQKGQTKKDLANYDIYLLLDKSGSMGTEDMPGGKSRWAAAQELTTSLARECAKHDKDGITVIPFSNNFKEYHNVTDGAGKVDQIFNENSPSMSTDTTKVISHVLNKYFTDKKKPILVLCVTDGQPDDEVSLANTIIEATKKMDKDEEIGISFIQIGKDPKATKFLKDLDDGLEKKGAKFDIVDTKTTDEMGEMNLEDVLLAALND